jgi:hypothetical protein
MSLSTCSIMQLSASDAAPGTPITWATSGMERIGLNDWPGSTNRIQLQAARGEYEPFQIGIRPFQQNLTNVRVAVSDLRGPNQNRISSSYITLYREHYVYVDKPSPSAFWHPNPGLGAGWYADGLIPFNHPNSQQDLTGATLYAVPFQVDLGRNQPIWVDVFVPRDAVAGQYTGTYTVTSDQGTTTGEIALEVWDFDLPVQASLQSSFQIWQDSSKESMVELLKHKIQPVADFNPAYEQELIEQWGLNSQRLPFWSGADIDNPVMAPAPSIDQIQAAAATHHPDLSLYVFPADEIGGAADLYDSLKQWSRNAHQAGVKTLVTIAPTPELYDDGSGTGRSVVDIWTVLPNMYDADPDRIAEVQGKGDQVWSYSALVQDNYSPKWQIDFAPINYRIQPGFISQSLSLTGILYWRVDAWTNDPWNDVNTYTREGKHYPGDGMLVYPGQQVGVSSVVPSMRLKWIREGIEDYEYVQILKNLGRGDWALQMSREVGADWSSWTRRPEDLGVVRKQLGEEIQWIIRESNL